MIVCTSRSNQLYYSRKNMHKAAPCPSTRIQYDSSIKNYMKKKKKKNEALSVQGYTTIVCLCLFFPQRLYFFYVTLATNELN